MIERITRGLLWDKRLAPREKTVWGVLILLAPLALAAGIWLQLMIVRQTPLHIAIDRTSAMQIARKVAEEKGVDTNGWRDSIRAVSDLDEYKYLVNRRETTGRAVEDLGVWSVIQVRFSDPEGLQAFEVTLTPSGKVTGYKIIQQESPDTRSTIDEPQAVAVAEAALASRLKLQPYLHAHNRHISTVMDSSVKAYKIAWDVGAAGFDGLRGELVIGVRAPKLIWQDTLVFTVTAEAKETVKGKRKTAFKTCYVIFLSIVFLFLATRYVKRRTQKEASRQRMYLVTLVIGSAFVATVLLLDVDMKVRGEQAVPSWMPLLFIVLIGYLIGLCGGLSYAGAESDLRETHEDLLISLDALLSGKIFSRNVGRSILMGAVVLGWMLLMRNTIYLASRPPYPGLDSLDAGYSTLFSQIPALTLLVTAVSSGVFLCLSTILGPLTLLQRYIKKRSLVAYLLVPITWFCLSFITDEPIRFPASSILSLVQVAAMLVSFFAVDLLATLVVGTGFGLIVWACPLAEIAPLWAPHVTAALLLAGAVLVVESICAFFGRVVLESEVRPKYAKDIGERLELQSEVEAAKEAQKRLLPASPPQIPGLSVAASCSASDVVSGDFYDFFLIGTQRLGILISDGGGNGLATALFIAMTKGYLMHKSQAGLGPVETLRGLQAALGAGTRGIDAEGLCYAVIDLKDATLRYARLGDTPSILISGGSDPSEILHQQDGLALWEGFAPFPESGPVVLYTNGLSRLIGEPDRSSTNRWLLKRINGLEDQAAEKLHESILRTIFTKRAGLGKRTAKDDVTVIVIGLDRRAVNSLEDVA